MGFLRDKKLSLMFWVLKRAHLHPQSTLPLPLVDPLSNIASNLLTLGRQEQLSYLCSLMEPFRQSLNLPKTSEPSSDPSQQSPFSPPPNPISNAFLNNQNSQSPLQTSPNLLENPLKSPLKTSKTSSRAPLKGELLSLPQTNHLIYQVKIKNYFIAVPLFAVTKLSPLELDKEMEDFKVKWTEHVRKRRQTIEITNPNELLTIDKEAPVKYGSLHKASVYLPEQIEQAEDLAFPSFGNYISHERMFQDHYELGDFYGESDYGNKGRGIDGLFEQDVVKKGKKGNRKGRRGDPQEDLDDWHRKKRWEKVDNERKSIGFLSIMVLKRVRLFYWANHHK